MPSVRKRENPFALPKFATSFNLTRNRAWIDRLELTFTGGRVPAWNTSDLMSHFRQVAGGAGPLRKPSRHMHADKIETKILKGWLFSGKLEIQPQSEGQDWREVKLYLKLNLTRFVQHQGFGGWESRGARNSWMVLRPLAGNVLPAKRDSLSGADNLISIDNIAEAIRADWADLLLEYVRTVHRCLDWYVNGGVYSTNRRTVFSDLTSWETWTVRQLEIYWEAQGDDAVSFAHAVAANAKSIAAVLDHREYTVTDIVTGIDRNSPSVNMKIAKDIRAAAYAKTMDRMRFEIRYDARIRQAIGVPPNELSAGHLPCLSEFIELAIVDAQERLSRILPRLRAQAKTGYNRNTALARTLASISSACGGDLVLTYRVLSLLTNNRAVSVSKDDELSEVMEILEAQSLVIRSRVRRRESEKRYQLAEPMQSALDLFG
ncbi:MAG: hypothetical protein RLN89_06885 [Parvibaculum sp.]